jgi:hypothetical protein
MTPFIIWWKPTQENLLVAECPFIQTEMAEFVEPTVQYPEGFHYTEQMLSPEEFAIVDQAANNHSCMDIKPAPHPPYSPTGR